MARKLLITLGVASIVFALAAGCALFGNGPQAFIRLGEEPPDVSVVVTTSSTIYDVDVAWTNATSSDVACETPLEPTGPVCDVADVIEAGGFAMFTVQQADPDQLVSCSVTFKRRPEGQVIPEPIPCRTDAG